MGDTARLEGFHSIVVAADDVPRNASAFASIDALLIDAPTLDGLDARQLGALLARAAACDRIVVLNIERAARRALDGAAGCGGRPLMSADSLPEALDLLRSSLATSQPRLLAFAGIGELTCPDLAAWHQVAVMLGVYVAAMALLLIVGTPPWVWLLAPALAGVALWPGCRRCPRPRGCWCGAKVTPAHRSRATRAGSASPGCAANTCACRCRRNWPAACRPAMRRSRCVSTWTPAAGRRWWPSSSSGCSVRYGCVIRAPSR
ncbi:MAG: hypothetical protein U1E72_16955 [Burkholderiaceae bacterium]